MSDTSELQAKIAALAGKISERKQQTYTQPLHPQAAFYPSPSPHARGNNRWQPYGRGGRGAFHTSHRNRVLVIGGGARNGSPATSTDEALSQLDSKDSLVTARRAGLNQVMTKDTFEREQKQKSGHRVKEAPQHRPAAKITDANKIAASSARELLVEGIRFHVQEDGKKMIRINGESDKHRVATAELNALDAQTASIETPKKATVADVDFLRSKHGNLIRATKDNSRYYQAESLDHIDLELTRTTRRDAKRITKPPCENFTKHGTYHTHDHHPPCWHRQCEDTTESPSHNAGQQAHSAVANNFTGTCSFGPACKFTHNPTKTAICKEFLRNGLCKAGRHCNLSHEPTYHRVPACTHFIRGNCINSACRYPHVNISPAARVCRPFATLGFCGKGPDCEHRHVFECPDYSNHGHCADREKGACALPHIDHAGVLRRAAQRQAKTGSENESDVSSSDEEDQLDDDMEDDDSDIVMVTDEEHDGHTLSQQADFIAFS